MNAQQSEQQPSDLVATLTRAAATLTAQRPGDDATPMSVLALRSRAAVVVECFRQVAAQTPIGALGVDFVAAAQWLSGYYTQAAAGLQQQAQPTLLGAGGASLTGAATPVQLGRVAEAISDVASMWQMVGEAAQRDGYAAMVARYEAWRSVGGCEPDADVLEYFGGVAPDTATVPGILRIWTTVVAGLVTTVTSGQLRGGRQEVMAMTSIMAQTAREAAVMAAMMGVEGSEAVS